MEEVNQALVEEKTRTLRLQAQVEEQAKELKVLQAAVRIKPDSEMDLEDWRKETMALRERESKTSAKPITGDKQKVKPRFETHDGTRPTTYYNYDLVTDGLVNHLYAEDEDKKFCYLNHITGVAADKIREYAIGSPLYKALDYAELRLAIFGVLSGKSDFSTDLENMKTVEQGSEDSLETFLNKKKELWELAVRERPEQRAATFMQLLESVAQKLKNGGMRYRASGMKTTGMTWEEFKEKLFEIRLAERCRVKNNITTHPAEGLNMTTEVTSFAATHSSKGVASLSVPTPWVPAKDKSSGLCYNCREEGHMAADCPKPKKSPPVCWRCNHEGHVIQKCKASFIKGTKDPCLDPDVIWQQRNQAAGSRGRGGRGGRGGVRAMTMPPSPELMARLEAWEIANLT